MAEQRVGAAAPARVGAQARSAAEAREEATTQPFWHDSVRRAPDGRAAQHVHDLLEWFDGASVIVAYNGRTFDMQVLRRAYGGDDDAAAAGSS